MQGQNQRGKWEDIRCTTGALDIHIDDGPQVDAFGRLRISTPSVLFDNKFIKSKNSQLWDELLVGCIMVHGTVTGTFTAGQVFTGGTTGLTGTISTVSVGSFTYTTDDNEFLVGEIITTATGSAVVTSTNTGADIEYQFNRASVALKVGTVAGQRVVRQTYRYFPYMSGFSQIINTTQIFNAGKTNLKQTVMYGDSLNGIGFTLVDNTLNLLIRSNTSGSPIDTLYPQNEWSIDRLDHSESNNPSGLLLDITKFMIAGIDFQWLGGGRVRYALSIDGKSIPIHEVNHANTTSVVYMRTPSLPIRYEIENTGTTSSISLLEQVCCMVATEGNLTAPPGSEYSISHGVSERTLASITKTPVLAIRLKNASENGGLPVRTTVKLVNAGGFARASDVYFELVHVHGLKTFTGTWTDVDDSSMVRVSKDISAFTAKHIHEIEGLMIPTGGSTQASGSNSLNLDVLNNHIFLSQNMASDSSNLFIIYATSRSGTAYTSNHFTWVEYD